MNFLELPLVNLKSVYINQSNVCNELSSDDINIGKQKPQKSITQFTCLAHSGKVTQRILIAHATCISGSNMGYIGVYWWCIYFSVCNF